MTLWSIPGMQKSPSTTKIGTLSILMSSGDFLVRGVDIYSLVSITGRPRKGNQANEPMLL
jgi:hypothetical protein